MSNFPILDLVVGMLFIFFVLSIICSSAVEIAMGYFKVRSKILTEWLTTIFSKAVNTDNGPKKLGIAILDHCSVTALSANGSAPAYIDAKNFAAALIEKISFDPGDPNSVPASLDEIQEKIKASDALSPELKRVLLSYTVEAKSTFASITLKIGSETDLFKSKVENWFDSSMDRVGGTLKTRYMRPFTLIVATVVSILMNADSIAIAKYLYNNPEARTQLADAAGSRPLIDSMNNRLNNAAALLPKGDTLTMEQFERAIKERNSIIKDANATLEGTIPLGWSREEFTPAQGRSVIPLLIAKVIGLAATVLAIMMGAPFWFDVLGKVSNLRSSGAKPARSADSQPG